MSETRSFKYADGKTFTVPYLEIDSYSYVRIEKANLLAQVPVILASMDDQTAPAWLTWHWTAGSYDYPFNHYQINVGEDYVLMSLYSTSYDYFAHTWMRNGLNLGMSYMAMGGAVTEGMYDDDIRKIPTIIETGSLLITALKEYFDLNWNQITDHAAWANKDGYPGERWDNQLFLADDNTVFSKNVGQAKWFWEKHYGKNADANEKDYHTDDKEKHDNVKPAPPVCKSDTVFNDVCKKDWYADAIDKLYKLGIMAGEGKGTALAFHPREAITRAEIAAVIDKTIGHAKKTYPDMVLPDFSGGVNFSDVTGADWFYNVVRDVYNLDLMKGFGTEFKPHLNVSRSVAAQAVTNLTHVLNLKTPVNIQKIAFNDVKESDWYYLPVQKLAGMGIMVGRKTQDKGYVFEPEDDITRAEVAVLMSVVLSVLGEQRKSS